jgi:NADPH:quinone reductase-like Zn-dependent oxidoreductase
MNQEQMKAIRLVKKCEAKDLSPTLVERPGIKEGFIVIKVKAFGVNESEVTSQRLQVAKVNHQQIFHSQEFWE